MAGAFEGFQQGFGMANSFIQQQNQNKRADAADARQQQMADRQETEYNEAVKERTLAKDKQDIATFYSAWGNGIEAEVTPELDEAFKRNPMADPRHLLSPKVEKAVDYFDTLAKGDGDLYSEKSVEHVNDFFAPRINRGDGGEKRVAGIFPGQKPGTFSFELEVDQDGQKRMAPMTVNRGLDGHDDEVAQYTAEQAIAPVMGAKSIYTALNQNKDKMKQYLQATGYMAKGADSYSLEERNGLLLQKNNATGEYKALDKGRAGSSADKGTWETFTREDGSRYQVNSLTGKEETTYQPKVGTNGVGGSGKKAGLSNSAQSAEDKDIEAIGNVFTMNSQLDNLYGQIDNGKLKLGIYENTSSKVKNFFGGSDEVSRNFASFKATMEKLRNDSLRLNAGVQTDGDAKRAWGELIDNINDPEVVKQRLKEIKALNEEAYKIRQAKVNQRRKNSGADPLDVRSIIDPEIDSETSQQNGLKVGGQAPTLTELRSQGMPALSSLEATNGLYPPGSPAPALGNQPKAPAAPVFERSEGGIDYYSWNGKTLQKPSPKKGA
jgi:hypothetical protein